MATPPFKYQAPFPMGKDETEYYLLTKDHVSVSEFEGKEILKVDAEGLTMLANAAFRDVAFMLRPEHQKQVAKILSDPEASENDKYVALTFLRNAEVSAKGKLPFCQDTGTAIIVGKKGQQVWTDGCDEEALSKGVYKTYTEEIFVILRMFLWICTKRSIQDATFLHKSTFMQFRVLNINSFALLKVVAQPTRLTFIRKQKLCLIQRN